MRPTQPSEALAETDWLEQRLDDPRIRIVDLRYRVRDEGGRSVIADDPAAYEAGHIPGATPAGCTQGFVEARADGTMPVAPPERFAELAGGAGIGPDTLVVIYDDLPAPNAAARLWWTFRYYGHDRVRVLNGGVRKWRAEGRPLSRDAVSHGPATFVPRVRSHLRATKETLRAALGEPDTAIVDCMPSDMHAGRTPRPWGARRGHIPGAISIPWLANVLPEDVASTSEARARALAGAEAHAYRPGEELARMYAAAGVTPDKRVITYCDLGYAAANAALVLTLLGYRHVMVYDGSFAEWSRDPTLPVTQTIGR